MNTESYTVHEPRWGWIIAALFLPFAALGIWLLLPPKDGIAGFLTSLAIALFFCFFFLWSVCTMLFRRLTVVVPGYEYHYRSALGLERSFHRTDISCILEAPGAVIVYGTNGRKLCKIETNMVNSERFVREMKGMGLVMDTVPRAPFRIDNTDDDFYGWTAPSSPEKVYAEEPSQASALKAIGGLVLTFGGAGLAILYLFVMVRLMRLWGNESAHALLLGVCFLVTLYCFAPVVVLLGNVAFRFRRRRMMKRARIYNGRICTEEKDRAGKKEILRLWFEFQDERGLYHRVKADGVWEREEADRNRTYRIWYAPEVSETVMFGDETPYIGNRRKLSAPVILGVAGMVLALSAFFGIRVLDLQRIDREGLALQADPYREPAVTNQIVRQDAETLRWIYTANAMVYDETFDPAFIGGCDPQKEENVTRMQEELEQSWHVDDRESLLEAFNRLLVSGHREGCAEYIAQIRENGWDTLDDAAFDRVLSEIEDKKERLRLLAARMAERAFGDVQIFGWDYTRALRLLDRGYIAGYITVEEYISLAVPVAERLQETFDTWEDLWYSFACGNLYWGWSYYDDDMNASGFEDWFADAKEFRLRGVYRAWETLPSYKDTVLTAE